MSNSFDPQPQAAKEPVPIPSSPFLETANGTPSTVPYSPAPAQPVRQSAPVAPAPQAYYPYESEADSDGSWMLATFLSVIPVVGFIYMIVLAFGGTASVARRNWARALFIWQLIGMGFMLLLILTGGLGLFSSLNN